ncbi:reverse transcriptase domain-containing protein [Tanacetum coccineum]
MTPILEYLTEETLPMDVKKERALKRKSQRFAIINKTLYRKSFLEPWLRYVGPLQANYALREIQEGSCVACMQDNPFKDWREQLCIRQHFTSVKHPQTNGLVKRTNRSLGEGIKERLDARRKNWIEELPHNSGSGPGTEAKSKAKIEKYYNSKVQNTSFKPGDLVYRNYDTSREEDTGKLGPKWEGPYEVTEALGKGAYKLRDRDEKQLLRTWNINNLKKCYVYKM